MHQGVFAGDGVDEHIQPAALAVDAIEQRLHLRFGGVIDAHGDRFVATGHDHFGGFLDRFRPVVWRWVATHATAGAIDQGTGFAESARDAAPGATSGACDQGDLSGE